MATLRDVVEALSNNLDPGEDGKQKGLPGTRDERLEAMTALVRETGITGRRLLRLYNKKIDPLENVLSGVQYGTRALPGVGASQGLLGRSMSMALPFPAQMLSAFSTIGAHLFLKEHAVAPLFTKPPEETGDRETPYLFGYGPGLTETTLIATARNMRMNGAAYNSLRIFGAGGAGYGVTGWGLSRGDKTLNCLDANLDSETLRQKIGEDMRRMQEPFLSTWRKAIVKSLPKAPKSLVFASVASATSSRTHARVGATAGYSILQIIRRRLPPDSMAQLPLAYAGDIALAWGLSKRDIFENALDSLGKKLHFDYSHSAAQKRGKAAAESVGKVFSNSFRKSVSREPQTSEQLEKPVLSHGGLRQHKQLPRPWQLQGISNEEYYARGLARRETNVSRTAVAQTERGEIAGEKSRSSAQSRDHVVPARESRQGKGGVSAASKHPSYFEWNEEGELEKWTSQKHRPIKCDALQCSSVSTLVEQGSNYYGLIDVRLMNNRKPVTKKGTFLALEIDSLSPADQYIMDQAVSDGLGVTIKRKGGAITLLEKPPRQTMRLRRKKTVTDFHRREDAGVSARRLGAIAPDQQWPIPRGDNEKSPTHSEFARNLSEGASSTTTRQPKKRGGDANISRIASTNPQRQRVSTLASKAHRQVTRAIALTKTFKDAIARKKTSGRSAKAQSPEIEQSRGGSLRGMLSAITPLNSTAGYKAGLEADERKRRAESRSDKPRKNLLNILRDCQPFGTPNRFQSPLRRGH